VIAVLLALAGINFMASVKSALITAAVNTAGVISLVALIGAFKYLK